MKGKVVLVGGKKPLTDSNAKIKKKKGKKKIRQEDINKCLHCKIPASCARVIVNRRKTMKEKPITIEEVLKKVHELKQTSRTEKKNANTDREFYFHDGEVNAYCICLDLIEKLVRR